MSVRDGCRAGRRIGGGAYRGPSVADPRCDRYTSIGSVRRQGAALGGLWGVPEGEGSWPWSATRARRGLRNPKLHLRLSARRRCRGGHGPGRRTGRVSDSPETGRSGPGRGPAGPALVAGTGVMPMGHARGRVPAGGSETPTLDSNMRTSLVADSDISTTRRRPFSPPPHMRAPGRAQLGLYGINFQVCRIYV